MDKRILTACIENDQAQPLGPIEGSEEPIERNRLVLRVTIACQLGIGRDQIVDAVDFNAVAGKVDDSDVGIGRGIFELPDSALEIQIADVVKRGDHVVAGLLKHLRHGLSVPRRIGQRRSVLVDRIADDQCNALVSLRRDRAEQHNQPT